MMLEDNTPAVSRKLRKLLISGLIGGVVGFAASTAMVSLIDSPAIGGLDKSATIAALLGVLYTVIGLGMVIGIARPGLGAHFLNVEDAEELREQQRMLGFSSVAMLLWGIALIALALVAPGGPLPTGAALAIAAAGLGAGALLSILVHRACDELMRAINLEAGAMSFGLAMLVIGAWAMLAHLGLSAAPAPLDLLSLFYALMLLASFITVGRRGMLMPR